jgi:uncharacterized protein YjbI with pentapeptide repeats
LTDADLEGAILDGATLEGAILNDATWIDGRTCSEASVTTCE